MTARSTRRAAEMAVIDAAYRYREAFQSGLVGGPYLPIVEAREAVFIALEAMDDLVLPDRHVTGNNNPDTSHEAGALVRDIAGDCRKVFDEIVVAGGLTCDQIEVKLNRTHQSMSARVNQLRDWGWIIDSGFKRRTRSNRMAIVWRPSHAALQQEGLIT